MKTKQLLTQDLDTGNITIMNNETSVTVTGTRIARVEATPGYETIVPSAVHIDFKVQQPASTQEGTTDWGLILQLKDAVELGTLLIALGMEHQTADQVAAAMARLSQLISDYDAD